MTTQIWTKPVLINTTARPNPSTINGGGQQRSYNLPLAFLVLVEETLETVEDCTTKHKWLSLIHHGHEQHHDGWSTDTQKSKTKTVASVVYWRFNVSGVWSCLTAVDLREHWQKQSSPGWPVSLWWPLIQCWWSESSTWVRVWQLLKFTNVVELWLPQWGCQRALRWPLGWCRAAEADRTDTWTFDSWL